MKSNLLVCASGGRTSMYMLDWILANKKDEFNIVAVFANTRWEHPKTLDFVKRCDEMWQEKYGFSLVWVEAVVHFNQRVACTHKVVTYETASRKMEPFIEMCKEYGLPNNGYPHCTRELKENPIKSYLKSLGWKPGQYQTALGIRIDEPKRIKRNKTEQNKVYPLVDWHPEQPEKVDIIQWWEDMPFDLEIPEHLGNCVGCYKKSEKKLFAAINDARNMFKTDIEKRFGHVGNNKINGELSSQPRTMYRNYMTNGKLIKLFDSLPKQQNLFKYDDEASEGCSESCEAFV